MLPNEYVSVPVGLITGYLGAGKTTLMNYILRNPKGHKIAVIVNDIGDVNIDADLIEKGGKVQQEDNSLVPLQNGCICCTLQNDLIEQLNTLCEMDKFDYILIEASGVCEPIPIAQTITMLAESQKARGMMEMCHLDNVICIADTLRLAEEFDCGSDFVEKRKEYEEQEDIRGLLIQQLEYANIIIMNKAELVDEKSKAKIKQVIHALCPVAKIVEASYSQVDIDDILDTDYFDFQQNYYNEGWVKALVSDEDKEREEDHHHDHDDHDHDHDHHHEHEDPKGEGVHHHHHHHHHEDGDDLEYGIDTYVYKSIRPFAMDLLEHKVNNEWPKNIIRTKGYLWYDHDPKYLYVFEQAGSQISTYKDSMWLAAAGEDVQKEAFENDPKILEKWDEKYGDRENKIVFIGQNLDRDFIDQWMNSCLTDL